MSLYRRLLATQLGQDAERVYSHQLGRAAGVSAAQVRRDIMGLGYSGTPNSGYEIKALIGKISEYIDAPAGQQVALAGLGNLGRAILSYFSSGRKTKLSIVAAFDVELERLDGVLFGCRCYRPERMREIVQSEGITVGIIAVPADAAQETADRLVEAGVTGILNFAPVPLKVPSLVYLDNMDITIELETVAYFAQHRSE